MLVTQSAHSAGFHQQCGLAQRLPDPAHGKRPQDMSVPHYQHIRHSDLAVLVHLGLPNRLGMVSSPNFMDQSVHALDDLFGGFAARAAVRPNVPRIQPLLFAVFLDLRRCQALIVAIVPLPDVLGDGGADMYPCLLGTVGLELPGISFVTAKVEELDSPLSAFARADIAAQGG